MGVVVVQVVMEKLMKPRVVLPVHDSTRQGSSILVPPAATRSGRRIWEGASDGLLAHRAPAERPLAQTRSRE